MSYNTLTLKNRYIYNGSYVALVKHIEQQNDINTEHIKDGQYRFFASASFFTSNWRRIYIDAIIRQDDNNIQYITLESDFRTEHFVTIFIFTTLLLINRDERDFEGMGWMVALCWIACHLLVHLYYRTQEINIVKHIVKQLKLQPQH